MVTSSALGAGSGSTLCNAATCRLTPGEVDRLLRSIRSEVDYFIRGEVDCNLTPPTASYRVSYCYS